MAYAAVVSLAQILKQLLISADQIDSKPLVESLHGKISSLQFLLEKLSPAPKSSWSAIDDLETKIRDTVYKAQDVVEYAIQSKPDGSSAVWLLFLEDTIADIDSITKTADEIRFSIEEEVERRGLSSSENAPAVPPDTTISDDEIIIVGHDEYLERLKGMVVDSRNSRKVIPIVGGLLEILAYAAVVSLAQILKQLLISADQIDSKPLVESLHGKISSLQFLLEKLSPAPKSSWSAIDDLETKIRDTVYKAQDVVEYAIQSKPDGSSAVWLLFLEDTIADIDSITKTADEIRFSIEEEVERRGLSSSENAPAVPPDTTISDDEIIIVGHDEYLERLKGMVVDSRNSRKVIPIVGMPGIGKTTLAKRIYNDPLVVGHFGTRAWVTISPEFSFGDVLSSLLGGAPKITRDEMRYGDVASLLHQRLCRKRKRYLLVIDNIWDIDVWNELKQALPDEYDGSRIILTTPNAHLASYACWSGDILRDPFLNDDASWELLRRVVFGEELSSCPCPPELERIGRKIANNCEGHPLAIIEVGKLLRGTERTVANWKAVEEDENPLIIGANDDSPLSKALTPSYKSLPPHLKACFLYMGLLPRNTEIRTSKLIQLWVSEGFIEQGAGIMSLEEKADKCLDGLVSTSLVLVRKHSSRRGRTKSCGMHFVFRGLCISEAPKQDFFHIIKKLGGDGVPQGTISTQQQRICFHNNIVLGFKQVHESMDSISSARSLFCFGPHHQYPIKVYFPFKLLRVLDSIALRFYAFPNQVFELVRLRYLAITYDGDLPPSISMLFNLEVLVVRRHHHIMNSSDEPPVNYLPIEIWSLHKLKHLHCMGSDLLDPSKHNNGLDDGSVVLENLLTLSGVSAHSCVRGVLGRMPKLTKIGIRVVLQLTTHIDTTTFGFFGNFTNSPFETFKCVVVNPCFGVVSPGIISPSFSSNIRKMTLSGCGFPWENMSEISRLPYLQELKLRRYAFRGPVWETGKSEFFKLEFLLLEALDVECWISFFDCFPVLQRLTIRHCYKLLEIEPDLFIESPLEMIEVDDCSPATEIWARQMAEYQGDRLRVHIHSLRDAKREH